MEKQKTYAFHHRNLPARPTIFGNTRAAKYLLPWSTEKIPGIQFFSIGPVGKLSFQRLPGTRCGFFPTAAPRISLHCSPDGFQLDASIARELLPSDHTLLLGISAVIELADGSKSYWALEHGAPQPDFHLRQSFALTLHRNMP